MDDEITTVGNPTSRWPSAGARRRARVAKLAKKGQTLSPVVIEGRAIATTFWGKAWCDNLERYSDFANRLPRGRTYVRNGSVVDLQIAPGAVHGAGERLRALRGRRSRSTPVPKARWKAHLHATARARSTRWSSCCRAGSRKGVMARICQAEHRALSRRRRRSRSRAAARTGRRCASTSRPCSTASAPGSTNSPSCCSRCGRWISRISSPTAGTSLPRLEEETGGRESARHRRSVRDLRHRHRTGHVSHAARHSSDAGSRRASTSRPPDAGVSHETASARSEPDPSHEARRKGFCLVGRSQGGLEANEGVLGRQAARERLKLVVRRHDARHKSA